MGQVYRAWQPDLGRAVAVKLLVAGEHASAEAIRRFHREARLAARLQHPGIVPIHDLGLDGGRLFLVMELVAGRSLAEQLAQRRPAPAQALRIAAEAAAALHYAHEQGVVHRDVKPSNILIDQAGRVRLLDFGLAKSSHEEGELTAAGTLLGTPHYMSPEQAFSSPEEVDRRADVYALGAVLYEMLTGRRPHEGATVLAVLRKIDEEEPLPPSRRCAELGRSYDALLARALAKDPARRYATAAEFAAAIEALAAPRRRVHVPLLPGSWRRPAALAAATASGALVFFLLRRGAPAPPAAEARTPEAAWQSAQSAWEQAGQASETAARLAHTQAALQYLDEADAAGAGAASLYLRAAIERGRGRFGAAAATWQRLADVEPHNAEAPWHALLDRLASAPALLQFLGFGLLPGLDPVSVHAVEERLRELGAPMGTQSLAGSLSRGGWGLFDRADALLETARAQGAPSAEVAFVNATLALHAHWHTPQAAEVRLRAVLDELAQTSAAHPEDLRLRQAQAMIACALGAWREAQTAADALLSAAPEAAESHLLRAVLEARPGSYARAQEHFDTAVRFDPELDAELGGTWLRVLVALDQPSIYIIGAEEGMALRAQLDRRLSAESAAEQPAEWFLRAWLRLLEDDLAGAREDLLAVGMRSIAIPQPELAALAALAGTDAWLSLHTYAADLHLRLGQLQPAEAAAARVERLLADASALPAPLTEGETQYLNGWLAWFRARRASGSQPVGDVLALLQETLPFGYGWSHFVQAPEFLYLLEDPAFQEFLLAISGLEPPALQREIALTLARAHASEPTYRWLVRQWLEQALQHGAPARELEVDAQLRPGFADAGIRELLDRYLAQDGNP